MAYKMKNSQITWGKLFFHRRDDGMRHAEIHYTLMHS